MKTNGHNDGHLDRTDGGPSPLPDATGAEMFVFLAKTLQMWHYMRYKTDRLVGK